MVLLAVWIEFMSDSIWTRWGLARDTSSINRVSVMPWSSQTSLKMGAMMGRLGLRLPPLPPLALGAGVGAFEIVDALLWWGRE